MGLCQRDPPYGNVRAVRVPHPTGMHSCYSVITVNNAAELKKSKNQHDVMDSLVVVYRYKFN